LAPFVEIDLTLSRRPRRAEIDISCIEPLTEVCEARTMVRIGLLLGLGLLLSASPAAATGRTTASFYSPSRNLGCEMDDRRSGVPNQVYCQSIKAPHNVRMGLDARLTTCRGVSCLGNAPENTPVLPYGKQVTVGRFRCFSLRSGIKCIVVRSGKGFLIDRVGVRGVG
jgi:hypothetical protein